LQQLKPIILFFFFCGLSFCEKNLQHEEKTMKVVVVVCLLLASATWAQSGCFTGNRGQQICYDVGDLTKTTADALVNAANSQLNHGGGIAGAVRNSRAILKKIWKILKILRFWQLSLACGPQLQMASDAIVAAGGSIPVSETAGK
jgi:hypothetical protein